MQTPEPKGNWERSAASLTLGHRHRHSTGAGRPRGHVTQEGDRGPRSQMTPRTGDQTQRGRAEWHRGARLVAASLPSPPSGRRRKTWAPRLGKRKGRGGLSPHAAREGSPGPFRRCRVSGSHPQRINKLQSREKGGGSLGWDCFLSSSSAAPLLVPFVVWSRPSPFGGGNAHTGLVCTGGAVLGVCELPHGGLRRDSILERGGNGPAFGRVFIQVGVRSLDLRPDSSQSGNRLVCHPAFPSHHPNPKNHLAESSPVGAH